MTALPRLVRSIGELVALSLVVIVALQVLRYLLDTILDHLEEVVPILVTRMQACAAACWARIDVLAPLLLAVAGTSLLRRDR